jgi:gliding motility-associated-like protein
VVDNSGCIGEEAYFDIPVQRSPVVAIDLAENACEGDIVNLSLSYSTPGIDSLYWDFAGAEMMYGSVPRGPYGLRWNSSGDKTLTVIAVDNTCKSLPFSDTIRVHPLPDANISVSKTDICAGDSVELWVAGEPGASYQWLPHQFFTESNNNRVWGVIDAAREITVNITSIYNCKNTGTIWLGAHSCCQIYFPTAFTPNGDGQNDVFRMLTVFKDQNSKTSAHQITTFKVVNRWGQTVFETGDERTGWDGTFNGVPQDMGTYYYFVKYKCADGNFYEEKGEVTLIR